MSINQLPKEEEQVLISPELRGANEFLKNENLGAILGHAVDAHIQALEEEMGSVNDSQIEFDLQEDIVGLRQLKECLDPTNESHQVIAMTHKPDRRILSIAPVDWGDRNTKDLDRRKIVKNTGRFNNPVPVPTLTIKPASPRRELTTDPEIIVGKTSRLTIVYEQRHVYGDDNRMRGRGLSGVRVDLYGTGEYAVFGTKSNGDMTYETPSPLDAKYDPSNVEPIVKRFRSTR